MSASTAASPSSRGSNAMSVPVMNTGGNQPQPSQTPVTAVTSLQIPQATVAPVASTGENERGSNRSGTSSEPQASPSADPSAAEAQPATSTNTSTENHKTFLVKYLACVVIFSDLFMFFIVLRPKNDNAPSRFPEALRRTINTMIAISALFACLSLLSACTLSTPPPPPTSTAEAPASPTTSTLSKTPVYRKIPLWFLIYSGVLWLAYAVTLLVAFIIYRG